MPFLTEDSLHIVDGSLSFHCFWKLALQTKSGPTSVAKEGGYPFLGAESCTEQFPLAPFKGPSAVESDTHSCQPLVQGLEFCTRQFLSKLTLLRNKQHINFNGLLPYLRGKMLIKPCKTEMHCLPHQE